jgi:tight adherence protein B
MRQALKESLDFWGNTYGEKDRIVMEVRRMIRGMEDANETDVTVLRDFAERSGLRDIRDFVNVYESSKSTGADMGRAIARATGVIADRIDMDRELKSMMAAKLSEGRIVGLAPVALVLAMRVFAPGYMEPMYSTASGAMAALISLSLSGIAIFMTERINRVDF